MKNYFLSKQKIDQLFKKAFSILKSKGYEKAKSYFEKAFAHDPYRIDVHYRLAIYFAEQQNQELFLYHLKVCYNVDPTYYEVAIKNSLIKLYIDLEIIEQIKQDSTWVSILFEPVEPTINDDLVLKFKKGNKKNIKRVCGKLSVDMKEYLNLYDSDTVTLDEKYFIHLAQDQDKHYKIKNEFTLSRYSDGYDLKYEKIYTAIKELSPYLENVRFFMCIDYEDWIDEIRIRNGKFYSCRYSISSDVGLARLNLYEKLVKRNPKDQSLKRFISTESIVHALSKIKSKEIYDGEATYYLKKAKHYNPKNIQLDHAWGFLYWQNSEWNLAKKYFLQYVKKIRDYDTIIMLGKLYLWDKEYKKAQSYFSEAIKQRPNYIDAHFYRGICYEYQYQLKKAHKDYQFEIDQMQNYNAYILVGKGNTLYRHHFNDSARPFFNSAIEKAESYKIELEKQKQKSIQAGHDTDFYDNQLKNMDEVISNSYVGLSIIAKTFSKKMKFSKKAIQIDPTSEVALYNVGVLLQQIGKLEEAENYYNQSLQYDDKYIMALNNKSVIAHIQKKYDRLFFIANRMIEVDPTYANGWLNLGNAYFYSQQYKEALDPYYQFIKLNPTSDKGYHALCTTYAWLGEHEKSIQAGKKAIKINPLLHEIVSDIAGGYNNLNKFKQALQYAEKAIQINSSYYHPYYIKACVYAKMNKVSQAIEMIKKMLELDSTKIHLVRRESDFQNLKENKEFKKIVAI